MTNDIPHKKQAARESAFAQQQRQAMIRNAALAIVAIFIVGSGIWYVANETLQGERDKLRPDANPNEQTITDGGRGHVPEGTELIYQHYPPSSGQHYASTAPYGFYEETFNEGFWLHNLEHGDIVVLYNCPNGCPDLQSKLRPLMAEAPKRRCDMVRLLALPYSKGMATPIAVLAWGKQLDLAEFDKEAILDFYKRYEDRGPELLPCLGA